MTARPNLYRSIHKALRRAVALFLADLGATNPEDEASLDALSERWRQLHSALEGHAHHEDAHVGPALAVVNRTLIQEMETAHEEHHARLAMADAAMSFLGLADAESRSERLHEAYLAVAAFLAGDIQHMQWEEQVVMPALQAHYHDRELMALHGRIVAALSPEERTLHLGYLFPAVHEPERLELLQGMQAKLPPEAFEGLLRWVSTVLPEAEWRSLENRLLRAVVGV